MTRDILIGNLLSAGAMVSESISGTRQKQKDILAIQIVSQFFYGASAFFLTGMRRTMPCPMTHTSAKFFSKTREEDLRNVMRSILDP